MEITNYSQGNLSRIVWIEALIINFVHDLFLETHNEVEMGPRQPPRNLPMDSDIGLRSPCDGLLAKRRKQMREMNRRPGSFNSDSNSCDTPTSENSPRDLTTGPSRSASDAQQSLYSGAQGVPSPTSTIRYNFDKQSFLQRDNKLDLFLGTAYPHLQGTFQLYCPLLLVIDAMKTSNVRLIYKM